MTTRLALASASIVVILTVYTWLRSSSPKRRLPLPPGPKGWPLIGDILNRPTVQSWQVYLQWGKKYNSDILATKLGPQPFIILNSAEAANELLNKRSGDYSDRPGITSIDLAGLPEWSIPVMKYGSFWRTCRRLMHHQFHSGVEGRYHPHETKATHGFLRNLLRQPNDLRKHIKRMSAQTMISLTYGIDVLPKNDPYIELAELQLHSVELTNNPGYLVDFLPILRHLPAWFPGANFQNVFQYFKEKGNEMLDKPLAEVRRRMETNTESKSFITYSLAEREEELSHSILNGVAAEEDNKEYERSLRTTAGAVYAAGADTTTSAVAAAVLGLLACPDALLRAQQQIDALLKGTRLPTFEDRDELTWVTAIAFEALRWGIIIPLAVPHYTTIEDEYKGFRIPAGSIILPNVWAILHDPETYPDPHVFNPMRFINEDGTMKPDVKDPSNAVFGFGRRICPGRFVAHSSLWINIACTIASFNIQKKKNEMGKYIEPSYEFTSGIVSYPESYECEIVPRSDAARRLIEETDMA